MAARVHIIILDQDTTAPVTRPTYRVAFWADVPSQRQQFFANLAAKSVWTGALAADTAQLVSGAVVEQVGTYSPESSKSNPQLQTDLIAAWTAYQAQISALNNWKNYGTTFDGTLWVQQGVA